jgi:hypothetical protein
MIKMTSKKIIVDLDVWNCEIRASRPDDQDLPMPNDDAGKHMFFITVSSDRLNKQVYGSLKGKGLAKAKRLVDKYGAINMSGLYGSIEVAEEDFIPWVKEKKR